MYARRGSRRIETGEVRARSELRVQEDVLSFKLSMRMILVVVVVVNYQSIAK